MDVSTTVDPELDLTIDEVSQPDWEFLTPDSFTISMVDKYDSCGGESTYCSDCGSGCPNGEPPH